MYVEHKEAGEPQRAPAKVLKPSEAIRIGHPLVEEERWSYRTCALGAMWLGYGRSEDELARLCATSAGSRAAAIGEALGLSAKLSFQVSGMHVSGKLRLQIADELEAQGY